MFFVHAVPNPQPHAFRQKQTLEVSSRLVTIAGVHPERMHTVLYPSNIQPSRAACFDQLFVTHFIESFGNLKATASAMPSRIWLDELPILLASPLPSLVKHSIRAGSMIFYSTRVQDVSIQAEAYKWYTTSLQDLRSLLEQRGRTVESGILLSDNAICAAVMLIHFETVAGSSPGAWIQHVEGAAKMLETRGPMHCRIGFLHQLFRHLRLLTVSSNRPLGSRAILLPFLTY